MAHETKECGCECIGNRCAEQKRAGGRRPGTSARNKSNSVDDKRNSGSKQNKAAGEGLELVRGTKVIQSTTKETPAQSKTKPLEKA